ncbi:MAG: beta-ketoacyl synthase N-terminal-like domain-containing protein, partial [Terriglobales bacterium]
MPRRVVITGMGAVSPNGIGNEAFCRAILEGKSGVRRITRFDPSELEVQIAGEVVDFDELAWVTKHERKHVSRVVPLATAATSEALTDAGIDSTKMSLEEKRSIGVI